MGVYHEHVILYGWRFPYSTFDEWDYERREQYYHDDVGQGSVGLVFDGMSGDYAFVGVLQFISECSRSGRPTIPVTQIEEPSREMERELYRTVYQEMGLDPDDEPAHYVLTHHH